MRVLITGTSSGIGKAIAEKFLKEGFDVTGFDRKEASISQDSYTHFCLDIRDREQYPALAPFDIVINNAGVQNEDDIDINLKGTIAITEAYGIHDTIRAVLMIGSAIPELNFRNTPQARAAFSPTQKMWHSALHRTAERATALISAAY